MSSRHRNTTHIDDWLKAVQMYVKQCSNDKEPLPIFPFIQDQNVLFGNHTLHSIAPSDWLELTHACTKSRYRKGTVSKPEPPQRQDRKSCSLGQGHQFLSPTSVLTLRLTILIAFLSSLFPTIFVILPILEIIELFAVDSAGFVDPSLTDLAPRVAIERYRKSLSTKRLDGLPGDRHRSNNPFEKILLYFFTTII